MNISENDIVQAVQQMLRNRGRHHLVEAVGPDARLRELGLDSLDLAEVLVILEDLVGDELDPGRAGRLVTVADLGRLAPRET